MGERSIRSGPPLGRRRVAGVAAALALVALSEEAAGQRAPAPRERGAIVHFEESRGSGVIYLEQSGGMVTRVAAPVVAEGEEAVAKASPGADAIVPAKREAAAKAAPRRASKTRTVTPGTAGAKP